VTNPEIFKTDLNASYSIILQHCSFSMATVVITCKEALQGGTQLGALSQNEGVQRHAPKIDKTPGFGTNSQQNLGNKFI
jgi:hypothetical protein